MTQPALTDAADGASRRVTVVICAYTMVRWDDLGAAVESVRRQQRPADEIVLVIDHNPELLAAAQDRFIDAVVVPNAGKQGLSGARNTGVALATGDLIAFLDDDAAAEPDWLASLTGHFAAADVYGVGGSAQPVWPDHRPGWFPREFDWVVGCSFTGQPQEVAEIRNVLGCNMAFRREVFTIAGEFSTEVGRVGRVPLGGEETELCIRLAQARPGAKVLYVPAARVRHRVSADRTTWAYFRERCHAEGLSKARVSRLVGAGDALSSERDYVRAVLPRAVLAGLRDGARGRPLGFARAAAVVLGLGAAGVGYVRGALAIRFARS